MTDNEEGEAARVCEGCSCVVQLDRLLVNLGEVTLRIHEESGLPELVVPINGILTPFHAGSIPAASRAAFIYMRKVAEDAANQSDPDEESTSEAT